MHTVIYQGSIIVERTDKDGEEPIYLLKGRGSQIYVLPRSGRYDRFLAGYNGTEDVAVFLETFFEAEMLDIFDSLAERYPQR
jgi:hypothetical protein